MVNKNCISILIKEGLEFLQAHSIDNPYLNCQLILMHITDKTKVFILTNPDFQLEDQEVACYWGLLNTRSQGLPLQYILRRQEFMGIDLYVDPRVLIPRPDTEILVEQVINQCRRNGVSSPRILDIGTGSGAISIALAHYIEKAQVMGVDISQGALEVASINCRQNKLEDRVKFIHSDLFQRIEDTYDIIVSNPPYIPKQDIKGLMEEVREHEPYGALDGGEDGLDYYRAITREAPNFLRDKGLLAFEIGHDQGIAVKQLLEQNHFQDVKVIKDLAGLDRVVLGYIVS